MDEQKEEIWADIPGYEGLYKVSNIGRVKSVAKYKYATSGLNKGKLQCIAPEKIKNQSNANGYCQVILSKDGNRRNFPVHRLVALAFIPNKLPEKTQVNHIDGSRDNNHVENLEWVTPKENIHHAIKIGHFVPGEDSKKYWENNKNRQKQSKLVKDMWSKNKRKLVKMIHEGQQKSKSDHYVRNRKGAVNAE